MAVFKCKMCGGDLVVAEGSTVCECEYCGTNQTVPSADNEKKVNLFNRANRLRTGCEFDKAAGVYESIVAEFPEEAEAYWGLCLCKYGIEYVDDPATAKKIPTCHRTSYDDIFHDNNFDMAQEYADSVARQIYRSEAKEIDRLQKEILNIAKNEEPYDIFICYKELAEDGQRTKDSVLAQDMYDALTGKGYKVFFARITLEDKLGQEYEPYIFSALSSARIMLSVGTKYEYFNAVWVKNEWRRFLDMMKKDKSKVLIPCYADVDAYDMPEEFKNLQGQDMGKVGFIQDLVRGIGKIIQKDNYTNTTSNARGAASPANPSIGSYLKRAYMFLEDGDWDSADSYCEKILDIDPEFGEAYVVKFMAEHKIADLNKPFYLPSYDNIDKDINYKKILKFADKTFASKINASIVVVEDVSNRCTVENGELTFFDYKNLENTSVYIPYGINSIGEDVFCACKSLTNIIIPASVTSIGESAFYACESLKSIIIPEGVTSIGKDAFSECESLTSINIPEGVTSIGEAAFSYCTSLTSINISKGVTSIGKDAFSECESLASINIPASVTSIGEGAFWECKSLTSINISEGITSIGKHAFLDCESLTSINIPVSVTSIGEAAFSGCKSLTSIRIPDSVEEIGDGAFSTVENVEFMNNKSRFLINDFCIYDANIKKLITSFGNKVEYCIPDSVITIGNYAFYDCDNLESIFIPNGVTEIGESAFAGCTSLTSINIPDGVTEIGLFAFASCTSLTTINIPNGVTEIGLYAFNYCTSLTSINIPDGVTEIGERAFANCTSLTTITIPKSVTSIGEEAFSGCKVKKVITDNELCKNLFPDAEIEFLT